MIPNMGDLFAALPTAMEEVNGIAGALASIASSLQSIAGDMSKLRALAELDSQRREDWYNQANGEGDTETVSPKRQTEDEVLTTDPGDHTVNYGYWQNKAHEFQGRLDRDCELCNLPDRDSIHFWA